jgi:hypothetical protein
MSNNSREKLSAGSRQPEKKFATNCTDYTNKKKCIEKDGAARRGLRRKIQKAKCKKRRRWAEQAGKFAKTFGNTRG